MIKKLFVLIIDIMFLMLKIVFKREKIFVHFNIFTKSRGWDFSLNEASCLGSLIEDIID